MGLGLEPSGFSAAPCDLLGGPLTSCVRKASIKHSYLHRGRLGQPFPFIGHLHRRAVIAIPRGRAESSPSEGVASLVGRQTSLHLGREQGPPSGECLRPGLGAIRMLLLLPRPHPTRQEILVARRQVSQNSIRVLSVATLPPWPSHHHHPCP